MARNSRSSVRSRCTAVYARAARATSALAMTTSRLVPTAALIGTAQHRHQRGHRWEAAADPQEPGHRAQPGPPPAARTPDTVPLSRGARRRSMCRPASAASAANSRVSTAPGTRADRAPATAAGGSPAAAVLQPGPPAHRPRPGMGDQRRDRCDDHDDQARRGRRGQGVAEQVDERGNGEDAAARSQRAQGTDRRRHRRAGARDRAGSSGGAARGRDQRETGLGRRGENRRRPRPPRVRRRPARTRRRLARMPPAQCTHTVPGGTSSSRRWISWTRKVHAALDPAVRALAVPAYVDHHHVLAVPPRRGQLGERGAPGHEAGPDPSTSQSAGEPTAAAAGRSMPPGQLPLGAGRGPRRRARAASRSAHGIIHAR